MKVKGVRRLVTWEGRADGLWDTCSGVRCGFPSSVLFFPGELVVELGGEASSATGRSCGDTSTRQESHKVVNP